MTNIQQRDFVRAISTFNETHRWRALAILMHPSRVNIESVDESGRLFSFNGVAVFVDDNVPLSDNEGEILFLLGDCIEPAVRVRVAA